MTEAGAVFGELSALLDEPHSADVRALGNSRSFMPRTPQNSWRRTRRHCFMWTVVLARRMDDANRAFSELKQQARCRRPQGLIDATLDKIEGLLGAIGSGYIRAGAGYSGYPFA